MANQDSGQNLAGGIPAPRKSFFSQPNPSIIRPYPNYMTHIKSMKSSPLSKLNAAQMRRRSFLKGVLTAGAASVFAPRLLLGASPSGKVNLACCGIGNRGADDVKEFHKLQQAGLVNIVALCDTDMGAPHTLEVLKLYPDVPRFQDFRQMLDKMGKDIDAVSAAVPDFSHFAIAMLAMSMGKHVYSEKPMGHSFRQIELMMQAEKKYNVATQMGNQGHSEANYFQFKAWVDAGHHQERHQNHRLHEQCPPLARHEGFGPAAGTTHSRHARLGCLADDGAKPPIQPRLCERRLAFLV